MIISNTAATDESIRMLGRLWFEDDVSICGTLVPTDTCTEGTELNLRPAVRRHGKLWCSSMTICIIYPRIPSLLMGLFHDAP